MESKIANVPSPPCSTVKNVVSTLGDAKHCYIIIATIIAEKRQTLGVGREPTNPEEGESGFSVVLWVHVLNTDCTDFIHE